MSGLYGCCEWDKGGKKEMDSRHSVANDVVSCGSSLTLKSGLMACRYRSDRLR